MPIMFKTLRYFPSLRGVALLFALAGAAALHGCGGSGGGGEAASALAPPAAFAVSYGPKAFTFSWSASTGATSYKLLEDVDGEAGPQGFVEVAAANTSSVTFVPPGLLHTRLNARYAVQACNSAGCSANSGPVQVEVNKAIGYFKASNTRAADEFGSAVALSADGNTLAVGAVGEDSNATGVNWDETNNSAAGAGAVYVFARVGGAWTQQAYVKASNTGALDMFGSALALSADGNTLAVGAPGEANIVGNEGNDSGPGAGAVYVFTRAGTAWAQRAYLKAFNPVQGTEFGRSVALSADGDTLAAGAPGESAASGAAYVFTRTGFVWTLKNLLTASTPNNGDRFGGVVALSGDGNTLAVGAPREASSATTIDGDETDNLAPSAGAVYVFGRIGNLWPQQAYVKASNAETLDLFGSSIALSGDGNTLAVGAQLEASGAKGINGNETNNSADNSGAVYVFSRTGPTWVKQAYLKASNAEADDQFGLALALSSDGNTLAVGSIDWSDAVGLGGDQTSNAAGLAGAVYVFKRISAAWTQHAFVKASNTEELDVFGVKLALSGDGNTLAVGAMGESSNATGINGDQKDNSMSLAGAVYLY
jgi:hypothetical protein